MTVTLTYASDVSRVRINATSLGTATTAKVERSTDSITWTTVRGGAAVPVTSGTMQTLDDYEFTANVSNVYRVTRVSTISLVATGAAVTGNNTSVTPTIPTGSTTSDLMLLLASIRNSGTGTPNTPAGYTLLLNAGNMQLFGKIHTGSETNPTVSFTGGVANADTLARMATFRNAQLLPTALTQQLNTSQANIPRPNPPVVVGQVNSLVVHALWKQDDWTSVSAGQAGFTLLGDAVSTAGDDAAQSWSYWIQTAITAVQGNDAQVTGGGPAISRSASAVFAPTSTSETSSITPTLTDIWIKSIARPFLNRIVNCIRIDSEIQRKARVTLYDVIGRSNPVAINDVRRGLEMQLKVTTSTIDERDEFDLILASGDPLFIQTPPGSRIPTMYVSVNDTFERIPLRQVDCDKDYRVFTLPVAQVAPPGASVVGTIGTWQTVVNTYATWSDVIAAQPTWATLLELVGSSSEVIVP